MSLKTEVPEKAEKGVVTDTHTYPEGGLKAWGVVLAAFCIMLSVFGPINAAGVFELYFRENQLKSYSHGQISWIFSLYLFTVYFVGTLAGPVFDRHGHRLLVLVGSICLVLGPMLLSISSSYYQIILSFSILGAMGGALVNSPAYAAIGHYFYRLRGLATGIAASAGGIGGVIFPLMLRSTLSSVGFGWSMRILGFILLAVLVPSNLLLSTRMSAEKTSRAALPDFRVFLEPKFSLCCAGIFLMEYGVTIPLTYTMSYAVAHGLDVGGSYMLPALINAGSVVGRILPGFVADKIGRFNMLLLTVGGCAITVLALWLPARDSQGLLIAFSFLVGVTSGGNVSLIPVCIGQLCETEHYGRYLSTAMMVAGFGTLTGIPIGGALLGLDDSIRWTALVLFSGISYVASFVSYLGARVLAVGWSPGVVY